MKRAFSKISNQSGYTLVELAIVIIILGSILATIFQGYMIYQQRQKIMATENSVKLAVLELQRFKQQRGFFPCPAPLTAPRTDPSYGHQTDCSDTSVAAGTTPAPGAVGLDGIAVANSTRTPALANPRIRIGAIPFRTLNLDEPLTFDGYDSRLVYAMAESLGDVDTFESNAGGITITNQDDEILVENALFIVFSPGRNRVGAYDRNGNLVANCAGTLDSQNCDFDATFRSMSQRNATANAYDDNVNFFSELEDTMWVRADDPDDIRSVSSDNIGVGTGTPAATLDIQDRSGAGLAAGTLNASTAVRGERICPNSSVGNASNPHCFEPRNIGGDIADGTPGDETAAGNGMECPTGEYMVGIQDGRPICGEAAFVCPNRYEYITGINGDGSPRCDTRPCHDQNVTVCGTNVGLTSGPVNTVRVVTAGSTGTRTQRYRCSVSGGPPYWQLISSSGACTCTPSSVTSGAIACGAGWSGTYTTTTTTTCPAGTTSVTNTRGSSCTCAARPDYVVNSSCPNANYSGSIETRRVWQCPAGTWGPPTVTNTCTCNAPADTTRQIPGGTCPSGYTGEIVQNQRFDSSNGICNWVNDGPPVESCSCDTSLTETWTEPPTCNAWERANEDAVFTRTRNGPGCTWSDPSQVSAGSCTPINFKWKSIGSTGSTTASALGTEVGDSCSYSEYTAGAKVSCSSYVSQGVHATHKCQCYP